MKSKYINGWHVPQSEEIQRVIEECGPNLCPSAENIYRALDYFSPEYTRVVILGQDPYHSLDGSGIHKASGLAFGYNEAYDGPMNSSLANISAELRRTGWHLADRTLESWARQGVLLLNTQLTCELEKPMSHKGVWNEVVDTILHQAFQGGVIGLAWGREARQIMERHTIEMITTSHPCKYSANATDRPFIGSNCFNAVNSRLHINDMKPIRWGEGISDDSEGIQLKRAPSEARGRARTTAQ